MVMDDLEIASQVRSEFPNSIQISEYQALIGNPGKWKCVGKSGSSPGLSHVYGWNQEKRRSCDDCLY